MDAINGAYNQGKNEGFRTITYAFYNNNLTSTSETLFSISASSSSFGNIWDSSSSSANKSVDIPLYVYDNDGNISQVLNVVQISPTASSNGTAYSASASASCTYTIVTDTGTDLSSAGKVINLFGQSGLSGATKLILNGVAYVSAANNGTTQDNIRQAYASLSYTAQYVNIGG